MKWPMVILGIGCIAAAAVAVGLRPRPAPQSLQIAGYTMGGTWSVKVRSLPAGVSQERLQAVVGGLLSRLDHELSNYISDSDLSRFNASASTEWISVPAEM